jgi:hypothetical protein
MRDAEPHPTAERVLDAAERDAAVGVERKARALVGQ